MTSFRSNNVSSEKSCLESMLTKHQWGLGGGNNTGNAQDIYLGMSLKITDLSSPPHLPGPVGWRHQSVWKCSSTGIKRRSIYTGAFLECEPWWRHQLETFSVSLALCAGNSPVYGEFPAHRPVTRSFDVFFGLRLNKRLSKQSWCWWFETP